MVWRFQNFDNIYVNNNDVEALNTLVDYFNEFENNRFKNNIPFAKLYAFTIGELLNRYDTTIDNPIVHQEINRILRNPFEHIAEKIASEMNFRLRYRLLEAAGCDLNKHPAAVPLLAREQTLSNLEKLLQHESNKNFFLGDAWTSKEIEEGIKYQLKNLLNDI